MEFVAISMNKEVDKALDKFEAEFDSSKMDTMIHRFPPGLGDISSRYPSMVVPKFVAIGPYHHGKKHLEKMESVKKAAAYYLFQRMKLEPDYVKKNVLDVGENGRSVVDEARAKYFADETVTGEGMMKDDAQFADMMLCDACFLLLYMDAYNRSYGEDEGDREVNETMRRFLFSNRDRINNDIMLLENQLPWRVIQALMRLASDLKLNNAVGYFIAAMGSSFKIRESSNLEPYVWDDEKNPPPHLLALLRRYKTENHVASTKAGNREVVVSAISPMDLEQIGIELTASRKANFSDMGLEEGWLWSRLKLVPLSLDDTRAFCLVNMAAFEVCTASRFRDPHDRTAVCSYLALLAFFMVGSEDVHRLRKKGLLHGPNSDDDMLAFFKTIMKHLPDYGRHFAEVMAEIEEYKQKKRIMTTLYRWVYNNWKTVSTVVSIIIPVVTTIAALVGIYQALLSLNHNN